MKNIAIILAGGSGKRLGDEIPKQFIKIAGKMVIEHTIAVFQNNLLIDEIAVVVHSDYVRDVDSIAIKNNFNKLKKILVGGKERYHSSIVAINAYANETGDVNLIFHDAVRPLVSDRIINDCITALSSYRAVDVAIPSTDTIIEVNNDNEIKNIPSRDKLRNGQTPQAFKLSLIKTAYDRAMHDYNFTATDDCGVVKKYVPSEPIYVVNGELFNMKLTYKEDIFLLDKLFQLRSGFLPGYYKEKNLIDKKNDKVAVIFGGTYGIGNEVDKLLTNYGIKCFSFSRSLGVDVSLQNTVRDALLSVNQKVGKIDWVINTAGILVRQPIKNMDYNSIKNSIDINYMGAIVVAKESYPYLKKTKGSLLLYTSSSYTRGRSSYSIYSSSKAAIVNLVQALSEEWLDDHVKVNCINPERTRTPMRERNFGAEPIDTLLDPRYVAEVSFATLLADITGQVIDVKLNKK